MDEAVVTCLILITLSTISAIATTLNFIYWQETSNELFGVPSYLEDNLKMTSFTVILSWFVPLVAFICLARGMSRKARKTLGVAGEAQPRYILHCLKPSKCWLGRWYRAEETVSKEIVFKAHGECHTLVKV